MGQSLFEYLLFAAFTDAYRRKEIQRIEEFKTKILYFNSVGIKDGFLAMLGRTDTTQSLKTTKFLFC
ncbi:MAG TPA: hypothetical protein CFH81_02560 [Sulfurovum sp. UBA12169]|nr:MAG TPA: hypothetical protein CFH81_02560 [Sulfurovum sp. UBA12169]